MMGPESPPSESDLMARHGRCHCGQLLLFHRGPDGFKERCPRCGSVVRLQVGERRKRAAAHSAPPLPAYNTEASPATDIPQPLSVPPLELLTASESAEPPEGPVVFVEMVPLTPLPAQSWTRGRVFLMVAVGLAALIVGAVICLGVWWIATRAA
jgi:hypothetical protein